jgi:hypothetical protein
VETNSKKREKVDQENLEGDARIFGKNGTRWIRLQSYF